jgi:hypothetical protein
MADLRALQYFSTAPLQNRALTLLDCSLTTDIRRRVKSNGFHQSSKMFGQIAQSELLSDQ